MELCCISRVLTCPLLPSAVQRIEVLANSATYGVSPRFPAVPETSAPTFASLPLLLHPEGPAAASGGTRGQRRSPTVCRRTTTCTKSAGHQGFCSGHKGFKRRDSPTASSALGKRHPFGRWAAAAGRLCQAICLLLASLCLL